MIIDSRYKVLNKLGTGLLATVFKVKDIRTGNIYALKLFKNIDADSLYEKFSAEKMHHITKIKHPNLFHVIDFGNEGKHIYYISEFCEGKNLNHYKFRSSNIDQLYDIIVQTCYALSALHSQGIIHQDLKPTNIVYKIQENETNLKVMDYGFTKIDVDREQQNISSALPFVAPEIYLNQGEVPQSDFYSLGVILYKLTTGILPFTTEQISGFIAGNEFNLLPNFPRELNKEIPPELERLILRLLEKSPEDRFRTVRSIISYINKTRSTDYPYYKSHSIVNNIMFSDYLVRDDYAHQLLDYVPIIESNNGKMIVIKAGKGLGKTNTISLFRYHILYDTYYTFDYQCGPKNKDPFFALIKEFYFASASNKKLESSLLKISKKLHEYLFESEDDAFEIEQGENELEWDFKSASDFLFHLSKDKPLIFTIQGGEYLSKDVIKFLNYISNELSNLPIMIVLSINDPRSIEGLVHAVEMVIEPLSLEETGRYVGKLLSVQPPEEFVQKLWARSNGNPMFIEQILIDLTKKEIIWKNEDFNFNTNLDDYTLPMELMMDIEEKIEYLQDSSLEKLLKLSSVETPLSPELIKEILMIEDKQLFFFLKDCLNSEVMRKQDGYYSFTFSEGKDHFRKNASPELLETVSTAVIGYYQDKRINSIDLLMGVIKHAIIVGDLTTIKRFKYRYLNLLIEENSYEKAFEVISEIVELDFQHFEVISIAERIRDLYKLIDLSEWASENSISIKLRRSISHMKAHPEKNLIMGSFYLNKNKYSLARVRLESALENCITGRLKVTILLKLGKLYIDTNEYEKAFDVIKKLGSYHVSEDLYISVVNIKAQYMLEKGFIDEGINVIEDFIPLINTGNDPNYFIKLGMIHNTLAILYREKKNYDETTKNYQIARRIWEKVHYKRKLGTIYNNLGDVSLVKGDTHTAFDYFDKAMEMAIQNNNQLIILLTNLNYGEAYIKLGKFIVAEEYLEKAYKQSNAMESKPFYSSIINNLAIAKSKIHNFNYYYSFIKKHAPHLILGDFSKITPLEKSYFYYLLALGDFHRIKVLLKKYKKLFTQCKEEEFYNQINGNVSLANKKIGKAKISISKAVDFSAKTQSVYARMISYLRLNENYQDINELDKAKEYCLKAQKLCDEYNFFYWQQVTKLLLEKTNLSDPTVSLRLIIRNLLETLEVCKQHNYFQLEIEIYGILVQIYAKLRVKKSTQKYFSLYKVRIEVVAEGISKNDRNNYFLKTKYFLKLPQDMLDGKIVSRSDRISNWQEELFSVVKLQEVKRIRFFINKVIMNLFTPHRYAIILFSELQEKTKPFLSHNFDIEEVYSPLYRKNFAICKESGKIRKANIESHNVVFVPLKISSTFVGVMVISDAGELEFQRFEINSLKTLRLNLTSILLRIKDFAELNDDMLLMQKLMMITQSFFSIKKTEKLNQEIIAFTMDFISASRGFLISKDENENYIYDVAMDNSRHILKNYSYVNTDVITEAQKQRKPVFIEDFWQQSSFADERNQAITVYCAPVLVDHEIIAYIYFDNLNNMDQKLQINLEFMDMLHKQISVAYKNAREYETLNRKNREIKDLDEMKNDFINIVSHELKTPLVTLRGYSNRLSKLADSQGEEVIKTMQENINKLYYRTNDIVNFSRYRQINKLETSLTDVADVINVLASELEELSKSRNMHFKTEVEDGIPPIKVNWEAFHLLIMNLGLNAIRFTKDFGNIVIGARVSAFQTEEINSKPTIVIYIQDNGVGIPSRELKNVFQKFYELNDLYSHRSGEIEFKSSGLGLGLATAELITHLHKGKIWINSKENQGTTVFVAIPK